MSDPTASAPLPWIGGALAAIGALWAALRVATAKNEARLEAALEHERKERERERADAKALADRLGAALDLERAARIEDAKFTARALLRGAPGREWPSEWDEAPTGVREYLEIVVPNPNDPRREPVARGRLPSRPR